MDLDLELVKETILEMIKTNNNNLLIERFSFEERIILLKEKMEEISRILDEMPIEYLNVESLLSRAFFSISEVEKYVDDYIHNNSILSIMLMTYDLNDEIKLQKMKSLDDSTIKKEVIITLQNDKNKMLCLNAIADDYSKAEIINSFKEDVNKIPHLNDIDNENFKIQIIKGFKEDQSKMSCLKYITNSHYKAQIIKGFQEDKNKILCLNEVTNNSDKAKIISSFKEDSSKIGYLNEIVDDYSKVEIISSFKEDVNKITHLNDVTSGHNKVQIIVSLQEDANKIAHLNDVTNEYNKVQIIVSFKEDANKIAHLNDVTSELNKELIIKAINNIEKRMHLLVQLGYIDLLIEEINHNDSILEQKNIDEDVLKIYSQKYNINYDNLYILTNKFGYEILRSVKNNNIISLINSNKEDFEKIILLFDLKSFAIQKHDIDNILNAIIQREFRIQQHEIIHVFHFFEEIILEEDKECFQLELSKIIGEIDIVSILKQNNMKLEELIDGTFSTKNVIYLNVLHEITNKYIAKKREDYATKRVSELFSTLTFEKTYEKNATIKKLFEIENIDSIFQLIDDIDKTQLSQEAIELIQNRNALSECINYKKHPQSFSTEEFNSIKNNLKYLSEILNALYSQKKLNSFAEKSHIDNVMYGMPEISNSDIIAILKEFDFSVFKEKVLDSNSNIYQKLVEVIKKYKFVLWGDVFENILNKVGLSFDSEKKASFINNFYSFYPRLEYKVKNGEIKNISLGTLLDEVMVYGSNSFRHKWLLGKENYDLICKNPGPNSASLTVQERLGELPKYITKLYDRQYITVPPVNQTVILNNSKEISISVGKISDTTNLTLGERTGACMRIGGVGSTLFDFCLENENGFHVIFTNPKTQQFVSRVSGFRNGNTVFLNQLRNSCDAIYRNSDLVEATKQLANYFVEKTKDNETPINNVVISNGYAMEGNQLQSLGVSDIKTGFDYFYSDVSSEAVLLASNNEDNSLVPILLGPEKTEKYDVLRMKINFISNPLEIKENIIRIQMINQLLAGVSLDEVIIPDYNIDFGGMLYFGEDWYVLFDNEGNIREKYIMSRDEKNMNLANEEIESLGLEISKKETLNGETKR